MDSEVVLARLLSLELSQLQDHKSRILSQASLSQAFRRELNKEPSLDLQAFLGLLAFLELQSQQTWRLEKRVKSLGTQLSLSLVCLAQSPLYLAQAQPIQSQSQSLQARDSKPQSHHQILEGASHQPVDLEPQTLLSQAFSQVGEIQAHCLASVHHLLQSLEASLVQLRVNLHTLCLELNQVLYSAANQPLSLSQAFLGQPGSLKMLPVLRLSSLLSLQEDSLEAHQLSKELVRIWSLLKSQDLPVGQYLVVG